MKLKNILFLFLLMACAHETTQNTESPHWVKGIRNGEQALKSPQGNKTFYRRIAGSRLLPKQTSCDLAIIKAEEDIKKEFPLLPKIPFAVEVLFYDEAHSDCAVTLSVKADLANNYDQIQKSHEAQLLHNQELLAKIEVTPDEAAEILNIRSEMAREYALTGLPKSDFEKYTKDTVVMNEGKSLCTPVFHTETYSVHGSTQICWDSLTIKGYCTTNDQVCWNKNP
ncbi:MAG: hypothetical protein ACOYL6_18585 [Bacteriovoracaceae bacterium]